MKNTEGGRRIIALEKFLNLSATIAAYFDKEGLSVRFINSPLRYDGIKTGRDISTIVLRNLQYNGSTRIGTNLREKVTEKMVVEPARAGTLAKPVLVIIITDGEVWCSVFSCAKTEMTEAVYLALWRT